MGRSMALAPLPQPWALISHCLISSSYSAAWALGSVQSGWRGLNMEARVMAEAAAGTVILNSPVAMGWLMGT